MTMRTNESNEERALRDPMLTALLQDTFADDPALDEAPGRTEMIMRRLLAADARPKPSPWRLWGWATGAAAATAAAVLLVVTLLHTPTTNLPIATNPDTPSAPPRQSVSAPTPRYEPPALVRVPQERPHENWNPHATPAPGTVEPHRAPQPAPPAPTTPVVSTTVASALYTTGEAAHAAGDFETAYDAYSASYEAAPNPQTLLAASEALLHMGDEDGGS
jgi:hypothetical protein